MPGSSMEGCVADIKWIVWLALLAVLAHCEPSPKGSAEPWDWQHSNDYTRYNQYEQDLEILKKQPYFLKVNRNVSVNLGDTAFMPCRVKSLGEQYTVSWILGSLVRVLTVGHVTFSSDPRFSLVHVPRPRLSASDWNLKLKETRKSDQGVYECQINTEPKINHRVYLTIKDPTDQSMQDSPYVSQVSSSLSSGGNGMLAQEADFKEDFQGPNARISGAPVQYVSSGSTVGLECTISGLSSPPLSLYWKLEQRVVTAKERSGISLESERVPGVSRARLFIGDVTPQDSGNYSCVSDIASPASVLVIVTTGSEAALLAGLSSLSSSLVSSPVLMMILSMFVVLPNSSQC